MELSDYIDEIVFDGLVVDDSKRTVNNLFYSFAGGEKADNLSYFEKDLKDIPNEYLEKIGKLIRLFKNGTLPKTMYKRLSNNKGLKQYSEIKPRKIRIVFKNITGNNYLIKGVFIKKANNEKRMYEQMFDRDETFGDALEEIEISKEVEGRYFSYIKNNQRKGTI